MINDQLKKKPKNNPISYFFGSDPLRTTLKQEDLCTLVVDNQHLITIFQPYTAGGGADRPFIVKIPYILPSPLC